MMSGGLYLYFVVECSSKSRSDWMYIESLINYHYKPRSHSHKAIYASGKSNLFNISKIEKETRKANGNTHVIICADVDENDEAQNQRLIEFSEKHGFDLVWMNLNIEDVFLDEPNVHARDKHEKAKAFLKVRDKRLKDLGTKLFMEENPLKKMHSSNLMTVLDKYLKRK